MTPWQCPPQKFRSNRSSRNPLSLAVALNCGIGSSSLKADVNALDRLHRVRARNSSYRGSFPPIWRKTRRIMGASARLNAASPYRQPHFVSCVPVQTLHRQLGGCCTPEVPASPGRSCDGHGNYMSTDSRKPASFAVALNWGIGSSSLNAEVKAFVRLHNVRGSKSG